MREGGGQSNKSLLGTSERWRFGKVYVGILIVKSHLDLHLGKMGMGDGDRDRWAGTGGDSLGVGGEA